MKKIFLPLAFLFLLMSGCRNQSSSPDKSVQLNLTAASPPIIEPQPAADNAARENQNSGAEIPEENSYRGKTIDQIFSLVEQHDFTEEDFKEKTYFARAEDFQIRIKNFAPQAIRRDGKNLFRFKTLYPKDYHSNLIGISSLRGKNLKEIYVVATGPGAVCCTNYWITDVAAGKAPRNIFRSEDFGSFRDPMEIFDADGDGIYELMQFDSAFRYFMDDCGACSPEPRAVFEYDEKTRTFLPAKGIQQDFVREGFLATEKWLAENFEKLKEEDPRLWLDFDRRLLSHIVDTFYLGDERKAWKTFDKYYSGYAEKEKIRAEIKNRLKDSKFIQYLKKRG